MVYRLLNIFLRSLVWLILAALLIWALIRISAVQTWVAGFFVDKVEERLGARIDLGEITIRWPNHIIMERTLLRDQLGDTLLYIPYGKLNIRHVNWSSRRFLFGKAELYEPFVYLQEDPAGGLNLDFILNELRQDPSRRQPVDMQIQRIDIQNGQFRYHDFQGVPQAGLFHTGYIDVVGWSARIRHLHLFDSGFSAFIDELRANESSGLAISALEAGVSWQNEVLGIRNLTLKTDHSLVKLDEVEWDMHRKSDQHWAETLQLSVSVHPESLLSEADLAFFIPNFRGTRLIALGGLFRADGGSVRWDQATLYYPDLARFAGQLQVADYRQIRSSNLDIHMDTLLYHPSVHQQTLAGLLIDPDTLQLPFDTDSVGWLSFAGDFNGEPDNFSTSGAFDSDFGQLTGRINVVRLPDTLGYHLSGEITGSLDNQSGWLTDPDILLSSGFSGRLTGTFASIEEHNVDLDMQVYSARILDYSYQNVSVKGNLTNRFADGVLMAADPALDMVLEVQADFAGEKPAVSFEWHLAQADLAALHLNRIDSVESVSLNLFGSFTGDHLDNLSGQVWATNSSYSNSRGTLPLQDFNLLIGPERTQRQIILFSDYMDARIIGDIHLDHLIPQVMHSARHFVPLASEDYQPDPERMNDFTFNLNLKNPRPVSQKILPDLVFQDNSSLSGFFRQGGDVLEVQGILPQFLIHDKLFTGLTFSMESDRDSLRLRSHLDRLQFNRYNEIENLELSAYLIPDRAAIRLDWKDQDSLLNQGSLEPQIRFAPGLGKMPRIEIRVPETEIVYQDSIWHILPFGVVIDQSYIAFDSLRVAHRDESLVLHGNLSDLPFDTLHVELNRLNLAHLSSIRGEGSRWIPGGIVSGHTRIFDLHRKGLFLADLQINDFSLNGEILGETRLISSRRMDSEEIFIEAYATRGGLATLGVTGFYQPRTDQIHFDMHLDKLRMNVFNAVLDPVFRDIRGIATGDVVVSGKRSDPQFNGLVDMQKASFYLDYLNTRYTFTHPLRIAPDGFFVDNLIARDRDGNEALVNGGVSHNRFKNLKLDFRLDVQNFLCLDTNEARGDGYWGTAYATGFAILSGPLDNIRIDVNATTERGTNFAIPVSQGGRVRELDFIRFVEKEPEDEMEDLIVYDDYRRGKDYQADLSGIELNFDIEVTPNALAQIIIDSETGDVIRAYGRGNLNIVVDTRGVFSLVGEYLIDQGTYQFTLQNMPLKRFDIAPGGRVVFNGPVNEAVLDVDASYKTNASLYDLILDESNPDLRQRTPVECHLLMTGELQNPSLEFDIVLPPNSDDIARSQLANLSQEEMNRQVLSLLILNQFSPLPGISSATPRSFEGAGITTTTEVLSNQLNYLLSQITNDFDIGFNYLPGDELTSDEVAVALRAQLLENRMTINVNGNVDVRSVETDANQLVGDVEVEYKITPSGKLRVKAFTRANDRLLYEYSQYTQGFGIFFREEFDSLGDLLRKYHNGIFGIRDQNTK